MSASYHHVLCCAVRVMQEEIESNRCNLYVHIARTFDFSVHHAAQLQHKIDLSARVNACITTPVIFFIMYLCCVLY